MKPNVIIINAKDTVAVALEDIPAGGSVLLPDGTSFDALTAVPYSHKVALRDMAEGETVLKYGESVGVTNAPVRRGEWVHTHNLRIE
jgi:altronate hydrolase